MKRRLRCEQNTRNDSDDVSIEVTDSTLSISGKIEKNQRRKEEDYFRMERSEGSFSRKFVLPSPGRLTQFRRALRMV